MRLLNNNQVIASQSLSLATIAVNQTKVQQAIEGERLIWGKRTLVQLGATSGGCGGAQITRASLNWKFILGPTAERRHGQLPRRQSAAASVNNFSLANTVSLIGDAQHQRRGRMIWRSAVPSFHLIAALLQQRGCDAAQQQRRCADRQHSPRANSTSSTRPSAAAHHRDDGQGNTAGEGRTPNFDQTMYASFGAVARLYPQQDGWYHGGRYSWLHDTPIWFSYPDKIKIGGTTAITTTRVKWWTIILSRTASTGPSPSSDRTIIASGSGGGIGSSSWRTVVAINHLIRGGRFIAHEIMHAFGFVDSDAPNYQQSDVPGEDNHSKYNEGRWDDFADCSTSRTFPAGAGRCYRQSPTDAWSS